MSCAKNPDKAQIKAMLGDAILEAGDFVTLKLVAASSPGDPAKGEGRTYTFTFKPTRAVIEQVEQQDTMYPGGIYQVGDIQVQMKEKLREVIDTVGNIGDRMLWQRSEYRIVGKRWPETLQGEIFLYKYTMRKVDEV